MRRSTLFVLAACAALIIGVITLALRYNSLPAFALNKPLDIPVEVMVPGQKIDLTVLSGSYNKTTDEWTIDENNAFFANTSSTPNTFSGNTLIYAHNRPALFGKTLNLSTGDEIDIKTSSGKTYVYQVSSQEDVSPRDTGILRYNGNPQLTLLTCSGEGDSTRRLTHASLVSVGR